MGIAEIEAEIADCVAKIAYWEKRILECNTKFSEELLKISKYYSGCWKRRLGYYHWLYRKKEAEICHTSTS